MKNKDSVNGIYNFPDGKHIISIDEAGRAAMLQAGEPRPFLIGIDEAGRGPLAGPLVVGGIKMPIAYRESLNDFFEGIKDSKQLTTLQREEWFERIIRNSQLTWATAAISPAVIDRINIARAAHRGALSVYKKLAGVDSCHALLDGSLLLPRRISHTTIIRGDELVPIISAASIVAKVTRDRLMIRLHKKYSHYGFHLHKGYATELHCRMIRAFGYTDIHRRSFQVPNIMIVKKPEAC